MTSVGSNDLRDGIEHETKLFKLLLKEGLKENSHLFDFGCGSGRLPLALKANNFNCKYTGQDIIPELTDYLKSKIPTAKVICTLQRKLLVNDESQYMVVNFNVFTH